MSLARTAWREFWSLGEPDELAPDLPTSWLLVVIAVLLVRVPLYLLLVTPVGWIAILHLTGIL
jgi:hypothetical protein